MKMSSDIGARRICPPESPLKGWLKKVFKQMEVTATEALRCHDRARKGHGKKGKLKLHWFLCGVGDGVQGLTYARQDLYY